MNNKYKFRKLSNGLNVLLVPNKSIDSVNVSVFFRVGSRCEVPDLSGISHFLEHMFFKGTKKRPEARIISEAVDSVGGEMNAFTSYEYTGYYIKVAKQHSEVAVDVLSDMMINSKFEEKEINRERNVIKEEIKMYEDTPQVCIWRFWNQVLYRDHGLGRDIAGVFETVDNVNKKNIIHYRDEYYSVANGLIVVVGNFSETTMIKLLEKYWSKIGQGHKSIYSGLTETQEKPDLLLHKKVTSQTNFCVGVRTYKAFHPDHFVTHLISVILGQGMSSRLFINVRERRGLAYSISSSVDNYADAGNLVVKTGTDVKKAGEALAVILKEFSRIKKEKVEARELLKAKEYWKGKLIISLESPETIANIVGMQELMFGKVLSPEKMMAKIDEVTEADVMRVAKDIFVPEKLNMAIIGPYKNDNDFKRVLNNFK